jgi:hypothetical protein
MCNEKLKLDDQGQLATLKQRLTEMSVVCLAYKVGKNIEKIQGT